ncbi:MAG TPA: TonB-dependent receptor [Candidatus Marinimicrobia bacterium]|nr:TonB-dependent receptor [Candidatus Neomarinimicrobiota bacterium]
MIIILILVGLSVPVFASTITGKVTSQMERKPIRDALVILQKRSDPNLLRTTVSDNTGQFTLTNIEPGIYNIEAVCEGFFINVLFDLKIEADRIYEINIKLLKQEGKSSSDYCFMLGGIEVYSVQKELIPESPVTTRIINTGEIEHMQATSLGDILSLVPGVDKSQNPGLSGRSEIGLRSVTAAGVSMSAVESFGSTIIINDNQISTDANTSGNVYYGSATRGLDLRIIPADNIKSVEVITGIPSVEYGNFASGVIKVETKIGRIAPKFNAKINPDTKNASFSHGIKLGRSILDYHLNYGYSERDLRKVGDEFQRLHASGNLSSAYLDQKLETHIGGSFTKLLDNEKPTDVYQMASYDKGFLATGDFNFIYKDSEAKSWKGVFSVNLNNKRNYKSKWVAENYILKYDTTVVDSVTGIAIDTTLIKILPGFIGKMKEIGEEWKIAGKIQRKIALTTKHTKHNLLFGGEVNYEKNTGDGVVIDENFPYYGQYSSHRSYAFDDYPDLTSLSFYAEDVLEGKMLARRYKLMAGLRYDAYSPIGFNFKNMFKDKAFLKSEHGDFLSPRLNLQYSITADWQMRLGVGRSVKDISLGHIFKAPDYFKYASGDTIIEEVHLQYNPDLQAYSIDKYEASLDWKFSDLIGFSLTGYYQASDNMPVTVSYPYGYEINPDTITAAAWERFENRGWSRSNGIEFTMRTQRIHNFQYRLNVTYRFNKNGKTGLVYDASPENWEAIWYKPESYWSEKIIIDYQFNYISNWLGVWVTLDAQQVPLEHFKRIYRSNSTYKTENGATYLWYQGMNYYYERYMRDSGGRWLFNFRITKSVSQSMEVSLFVNNLLDDRAVWKNFDGSLSEFNPPIFYGLEVSAQW